MADDKGGGNKSWEPFEIIVVIILIAGLLLKFQNPSTKSTTPQKVGTLKKEVPSTQKPVESCGLQIARPHSLEKITTFVTLQGTTDGCNWVSTPDAALFAQVIDVNGMPVSAYTTVPSIAGNDTSTSAFNTTIPLTSQPATSTGYIILIPAVSQQQNAQANTVRIPITFSTHS